MLRQVFEAPPIRVDGITTVLRPPRTGGRKNNTTGETRTRKEAQ